MSEKTSRGEAEEQLHSLAGEILGFIEAGVDAEIPGFNDYALRLFAMHYDNNQLFRDF